jgi:diguanylate cyclase (GGDEF)-like protein
LNGFPDARAILNIGGLPMNTGHRIPRLKTKALCGLTIIAIAAGTLIVVKTSRAGTVVLRAGYNSYFPFVVPGPDGRPAGLAVDVVTEAARRAYIRLQWVPSGDDVDEMLRKGEVDFYPILTLTSTRRTEFHASQPWWENETALISLEAAPVVKPTATSGKRIAIRGLPIVKVLAESLFPASVRVIIPQVEAMVTELCSGRVDAVFLDLRLLQSQLLKGPAACVDRPLHVISVPGGSLSQGTIARKEVAAAADRIYDQIAELALSGYLSETASRWSMVSAFQSHHMKDILDAQQRARTMRYSLIALTLALVLTWFQTQFVRRGRRVADHQAHHDWLTGLPNRRCFESRLEQCIARARLTGSGLGLFYFDLDGFKLINDTLGHAVGDSILKQLVRRVEIGVLEGDTLARMGGDEFILIACGIETQAAARLVADKLLADLRESFVADGHELLVTASVGISLFPDDGLTGVTLLQHADAAMYEAKRQGKNRQQFYNRAMNTAVRERLELENHLRRALVRSELSLYYQPEIALDSNKIVRYEALLRWNSPALGMVAPAKFIPVAEEIGLIVPIGAWALEEACRHARHLLDSGAGAGVGVNVSSVQFSRPDFVDTVTEALRQAGLPPFLLELELTETVVMEGLDDVVERIAQLRGMGVSISMDDFGTGYSSLSYLRKLRIDGLKIDRSFIRDIPFDADALSLMQALISLAHGLGMTVVVEGVETELQLEAMRTIGCDMAQGFFLGEPSPASPLHATELIRETA